MLPPRRDSGLPAQNRLEAETRRWEYHDAVLPHRVALLYAGRTSSTGMLSLPGDVCSPTRRRHYDSRQIGKVVLSWATDAAIFVFHSGGLQPVVGQNGLWWTPETGREICCNRCEAWLD